MLELSFCRMHQLGFVSFVVGYFSISFCFFLLLFDGIKHWYGWAFSDSLVQPTFQEKQKCFRQILRKNPTAFCRCGSDAGQRQHLWFEFTEKLKWVSLCLVGTLWIWRLGVKFPGPYKNRSWYCVWASAFQAYKSIFLLVMFKHLAAKFFNCTVSETRVLSDDIYPTQLCHWVNCIPNVFFFSWLWRRRELQWFHEQRDLWFPPRLLPVNPPNATSHDMCSSEVPWFLGPNVQFRYFSPLYISGFFWPQTFHLGEWDF